MKYVAIVMVLLVVVAAAFGLYAYVNAKLVVASIELEAYDATMQTEDFLRWQSAVDNDAATGTAYTDSIPGTAADYSYFLYTFRLRNKGLINAEMVEIQPVPVNGDVLSYSTTNASDVNRGTTIPAGNERDVWSVLLTSKQNRESYLVTRSFYITYYIWGIPMTVTAVYN